MFLLQQGGGIILGDFLSDKGRVKTQFVDALARMLICRGCTRMARLSDSTRSTRSTRLKIGNDPLTHSPQFWYNYPLWRRSSYSQTNTR